MAEMPFALFSIFLLAAFASAAVHPLSDPAISPDRTEVAFISGGDIWTAPLAGGEARLLVSNPATESHPRYSPDGRSLAFVSNRTGGGDIYVLHLSSGELKRITFDDSRSALDGWSADGRFLYFTSSRGEVGSSNDLYRVPAAGGTPVAVVSERYADESQAAPHPFNGTIAFVSGNMAVGQWWRKGHAHIDETRLGLFTPGSGYQTLLDNQARNLWPMWGGAGKELYYVSDKSGAENIWAVAPGGAPRQLTRFANGRTVWPDISRDGRILVFERDFGIWFLDTASGKTAQIPITLRGIPAGPSTTHLRVNNFREMALSADGRKIALVAHGDVFAASAKDGGSAVRLTSTSAAEHDLAWSPDGNRIAYASERTGVSRLFVYDFRLEKEAAVTTSAMKDEKPQWSPDGKEIAWIRDGRELRVITLENHTERTLASHQFKTLTDAESPYSWSPDGKWIALFNSDSRGFINAYAVPSAGGPERPLSFLANSDAGSVVWSSDHTSLFLDSGQRTEQRSISRVDLVPRTPKFREDQFRDLFRDTGREPQAAKNGTASPSAAKPEAPVEIVFEGIRQRLSKLPLDLDARIQAVSPDGKTLLFAARLGAQDNLYTWSLDELGQRQTVARQLTSSAGRKGGAVFSPDGKEVYFLDGGRVSAITLENRNQRTIAVTAEMDVEFDQEKKAIFQEAWSTLNDNYYDPKFNGADWSALRGRYAPVVEATRTPDELRRVIQFMIGELNSSHSGISPNPANSRTPSTGRLGLDFNPEDNTITAVTPLGPAAVAGVKVGEKLLTIDGADLSSGVNADELLQFKVGRRILVSTSVKKDIPLQPVNAATERRLRYREWVEGRRAYVDKVSGGRLGYVHMLDMSADALDQLYLDLDTENFSRAGVVVDIRNNNGGFVNAYALDVFGRRPYLTMTQRDHPATPARSALGQRALERPTVLLVNQNTLSDSEDFTEGYRTLKLGKVVGVPTAGWIIFTGTARMVDDSALRMPLILVRGADGKDMELNSRPVDVTVQQPLGDTVAGSDTQLAAAVKSLLADIDAAGNRH